MKKYQKNVQGSSQGLPYLRVEEKFSRNQISSKEVKQGRSPMPELRYTSGHLIPPSIYTHED